MKHVRVLLACASLVVLAAATVGCSDQADDPTSGFGRVTVQVHDQAAPELEEAWVTFGSVAFRDSDGIWVEADVAPGTEFDLLTLVGPESAVTLASDLVPAGTYDAVRLGIVDARATVDGSSVDIPIDGDGRTILLPVPEFVVEAGIETRIVIDVPVGASFRVVGTDVVFEPTATLTSVTPG